MSKRYTLLKKDGKARRGRFETPHGTIETPVFMNVGTLAAIKGGVSSMDLKEIGCQVELSNTYHLHLRPSDRDMAGNIPIPSPSPWSGIRPTCGRHFMTIFVPQGWEAPPRLG